MKEKLLKILYKYSSEVKIKGEILRNAEEEEWLWSGEFDKVAEEIESEVKKDYYQKTFIEWLAFKSHCKFPHNIRLHKYWNGTINDYVVTFQECTGMVWEDRTLDELFDYWQKEIKDK
jgi:hypothetical protein